VRATDRVAVIRGRLARYRGNAAVGAFQDNAAMP
jgi:hypothetical protein